MKKQLVLALIIIVALAGIAFYSGVFEQEQTAAAAAQGAQGRMTGGRPGAGGGPGGANFRPPMTVELAAASRAPMSLHLTVVGNLVGDATVAVVPKTAGRLEQMYVKLGDRISRGQRIARIEDREIREQVKQAEAAFEVAQATIRQREADLKFAQTNLDRSRNLYERQLLPRQTLDDADARHQAAAAQLDLARAQLNQNRARLDELRITLSNTVIVSPVNGFVARRAADPGAFVSQSAPIADVVDINRVRLVANIVEKDLKNIGVGESADVEVDAYPGEQFTGRIARIAPVLDPATRTAQIEVEIPNPGFRLKPGMYARVRVTVEEKPAALVVPSNAIVDVEGKRGVFLAQDDVASFRAVEIGIEDPTRVEVVSGLKDGERVITTGAASLRNGDRIILAGAAPGSRGPRGPGQGGRRPVGDGERPSSSRGAR